MNEKREAVWWRAVVGGLLLAAPAWALNSIFSLFPQQALAGAFSAFLLGTVGWAIALRVHNTARDTDGVFVGLVAATLAHPLMWFLMAVERGDRHPVHEAVWGSFYSLFFGGVLTASIGVGVGLLTSISARKRRELVVSVQRHCAR